MVTFVFAFIGAMSLFAFDVSDSSRPFDMSMMAISTFGLLGVFAWVFLSGSLSLWGKCLGKKGLIKIGSSMLP